MCLIIFQILPDRPHSAQLHISSGLPVFLFSFASPKQKSQYPKDTALSFPSTRIEINLYNLWKIWFVTIYGHKCHFVQNLSILFEVTYYSNIEGPWNLFREKYIVSELEVTNFKRLELIGKHYLLVSSRIQKRICIF